MTNKETKGEYLAGINSGSCDDDLLAKIRKTAADLINLIEEIPSDTSTVIGNERGRLKALAQTDIETAAMHAVKAATKSN